LASERERDHHDDSGNGECCNEPNRRRVRVLGCATLDPSSNAFTEQDEGNRQTGSRKGPEARVSYRQEARLREIEFASHQGEEHRNADSDAVSMVEQGILVLLLKGAALLLTAIPVLFGLAGLNRQAFKKVCSSVNRRFKTRQAEPGLPDARVFGDTKLGQQALRRRE
jgi:hypothetical protein